MRYNCAYRQAIYDSGYTYYKRVIGHGLDNDARVVSAGFVIVLPEGNTWDVVARVGELNRVGPEFDHSVAPLPQDLASLDIRYAFHSKVGTFDIGAGYGRFCHRAKQALPHLALVATDGVPESLARAEHYLSFRRAEVRAVPPAQLGAALAAAPPRLAVAIHSLPEMTVAAVVRTMRAEVMRSRPSYRFRRQHDW